MNPRTVAMQYETQTSGAFRFRGIENDDPKESENYLIGTLYLRKRAVGLPHPMKIRVTIEEVE